MKSVSDLKRQKKRELDRKMKNDKEFRKKKVNELKARYWEKQELRIASKQSRPRSFNIWSGGKKMASTKKLAKRGRVKKGLVPV